MANKVPELLNDFRVYREGQDNCIGIATVDLPAMNGMTQSINGVGVGGEIDAPVLGHYQSMETKMNWRIPAKEALAVATGDTTALEFRGALQNYDSGAGATVVNAIKCVIRGRVKSVELGKAEVGNTTDSAVTVETTYLKIEMDGEVIREIDKYAAIDSVEGNDRMTQVREALGLI
jgi:P2 family phage contractile tail tube protein